MPIVASRVVDWVQKGGDKRLVPQEHIAFVEPFEPKETSQIHFNRDFKARVVLIDRDSLLIEHTSEEFAVTHGLRRLPADSVALNSAVRFRVERFRPADGFRPTKAYATRLLWRDLDGNDQSKLLLTEPEEVLEVIVNDAVVEASPVASSEGRNAPRGRGPKGKSHAPHP